MNNDSTFAVRIPGAARNTIHLYDVNGVFDETFNHLFPLCNFLVPPAKPGSEEAREKYVKQTTARLSAQLVELYHARAVKEFFAAQEAFLTLLLDEVLLSWCREELAELISPEALKKIKELLAQHRTPILPARQRYVHGEKDAQRPQQTKAEKKGNLAAKKAQVLTESVEIVQKLVQRLNLSGVHQVTPTDVAREKFSTPSSNIPDMRSKYSRELNKCGLTFKQVLEVAEKSLLAKNSLS